MTIKKPFLYSNQNMILPEKKEFGEEILNKFKKEETIYSIINFPDFNYVKTMRTENNGVSTIKEYVFTKNWKNPKLIKRGFDDLILKIKYNELNPLLN